MIEVKIYTTKHIGTANIAECVLKQLEQLNLSIQKIGLYEPLREVYTFEKALKMWTEVEECKDEEEEWTAGGFLGKSKSPSFEFIVSWWNYPNRSQLSTLTFFFPIKTFKKFEKEIITLFKECVLVTEPVYGYVSHSNVVSRQHTTGTLYNRLPGVFWCNYFGKLFVDFFGEEKISSFPWEKVEFLSNEGIITFLTEQPIKQLLDSNELETNAKQHLGFDSFGNPEEMEIFTKSQNPEDWDRTIQKNVPEIK
ncbi:hypothetical protein [Peribacillus acanthi]|uniref:hypothetical protein n=1 Tax=Peribacillus acanthi TaxID=2171554 RepID=UPI000D3EB3AA|nr:hypothetical protein [Peribacillus acanthi]